MTIKLMIKCDRCSKTEEIKYNWKDMISEFFNSYNFNINLPKVLSGWKTSDHSKNLCPDCVKQYETYMRSIK